VKVPCAFTIVGSYLSGDDGRVLSVRHLYDLNITFGALSPPKALKEKKGIGTEVNL